MLNQSALPSVTSPRKRIENQNLTYLVVLQFTKMPGAVILVLYKSDGHTAQKQALWPNFTMLTKMPHLSQFQLPAFDTHTLNFSCFMYLFKCILNVIVPASTTSSASLFHVPTCGKTCSSGSCLLLHLKSLLHLKPMPSSY